MSDPQRVQLSRKKGWSLPPNSVSVARPTKYGNPFTATAYREFERDLALPPASNMQVRSELVSCFRSVITFGPDSPYWTPDNFQAVLAICKALDDGELAGKNLACWCPLPEPGHPDICHATVLLELANPGWTPTVGWHTGGRVRDRRNTP